MSDQEPLQPKEKAAQQDRTQNHTHNKLGTLKKKIIFCIIPVLLLALLLCGILFLLFGKKETGVQLQTFESDEVYFVAGLESEAVFTVEAKSGVSEIKLYNETGNEIGSLHDDGKAGDEKANDGLYSYRLSVSEMTKGSNSYYIKAGNQISDSIAFYYFDQLTEKECEEAKEAYQTLSEDLLTLEVPFEDESGYVPEEQYSELLTKVEELLVEKVEEETVLLYEVEDNSVYIKFTSGLTLIYQPNMADVSLGDSDVELTFMTVQPCSDIHEDGVSELMSGVAADLGVEQVSYTNSEVTLSLIKNLPSEQVIFWNGHGGYGPNVKSYLVSGECFDWEAWFYDVTGYFADCVSDRIIGRYISAEENRACVTSKFISYYCGDLSDDILLLATCCSGKESTLADTFLKKGATAVLGFTEEVYTAYAIEICMQVLYVMDEGDYTLQEALEQSKETWGVNDIHFAEAHTSWDDLKSSVAEPVLFGGTEAEQYKLPFGWLEGTISDEEGVSPIVGALVTIYRDDEEYTTVVTDENGRYSVRLPIGKYQILATAYGYEDYLVDCISIKQESTETLDMAMRNASGVLSGIAYDMAYENVNLGGIEIVASYTDELNKIDYSYNTTTADDGTYTLELPPGSYILSISSPDEKYLPIESGGSIQVEVQQDKVTTHDIIVRIGTYLCGYVYDQNGNPLEGVCVKGLSNDQIDIAAVLTDANGYYEMVVYDTSYNVSYSLDEYSTSEITWEIDQGARYESTIESPCNLDDVILNSEFKICGCIGEGSFLDFQALEGVDIALVNEDGTWSDNTSTDEDGYFSIYCPEGVYTITFSKDGYKTVEWTWTLVGGTWWDDFDRELLPGDVIEIEVFILEELPSWKVTYAEYIQNIADDDEGNWSEHTYALVYVDDDDIPELYVGGVIEAEGDRICTIDSSGSIVECWLSRLQGAAYIENSGMICNYNGNNGVLTLDFYSLKNGVFTVQSDSGESTTAYDEENDELVTTYKWNGKNVSEKVFYANWDSIMDRDTAEYFYKISKSADEILTKLE